MIAINILGFLLSVAAIIFLVIYVQIFVRKLANKGTLWVRTPFMKYLAIEVDLVLGWILVACTDEVWERIHPECKDCNVAQEGNIKTIRVHKGLSWIGWWWKYRVKEWYETERDELDPNTPPLHSVALDEQLFKYTRPKSENDPIGIPSLTTADLIEIFSDLIVNMVVYDPIKALYYIRHRKTAILNMIVPVWREVVSSFNFFEYGDVLEKDFKAAIKKKLVFLSADFRITLGISKKGENDEEVRYTNPNDLTPGSVAHRIYNEWGTLITHAAVEDVDPVDPDIQKSFEKMLIAVTESLAKKQTAEGDKEAAIIRGEGYESEHARFKLVMETIQTLAASGNMIISMGDVSESLSGFMAAAIKSIRKGDAK